MELGEWVVKNLKERWGYVEDELVRIEGIEAHPNKDGSRDLVLKRSNGQIIVSNTRYYRKATEAEIKKKQLKEMFNKK